MYQISRENLFLFLFSPKLKLNALQWKKEIAKKKTKVVKGVTELKQMYK
jgi:hypothetical protein